LQQRCAAWLDDRGLLWCHVPNGGERTKHLGYQLKLSGVKPGVPDILVFSANVYGNPTAIELKRDKKSRASGFQKEWLAALGECTVPWDASVVYGWDQFVRKVEHLYPEPGPVR
jgi:hypothetical protein